MEEDVEVELSATGGDSSPANTSGPAMGGAPREASPSLEVGHGRWKLISLKFSFSKCSMAGFWRSFRKKKNPMQVFWLQFFGVRCKSIDYPMHVLGGRLFYLLSKINNPVQVFVIRCQVFGGCLLAVVCKWAAWRTYTTGAHSRDEKTYWKKTSVVFWKMTAKPGSGAATCIKPSPQFILTGQVWPRGIWRLIEAWNFNVEPILTRRVKFESKIVSNLKLNALMRL